MVECHLAHVDRIENRLIIDNEPFYGRSAGVEISFNFLPKRLDVAIVQGFAVGLPGSPLVIEEMVPNEFAEIAKSDCEEWMTVSAEEFQNMVFLFDEIGKMRW